MRITTIILTGLLSAAMLSGSVSAAGYLKIGDIKGESSAAGDEHEVEYNIAAAKFHGRYADITLKRGVMADTLESAFRSGAVLSNLVITSDQNGRTKSVMMKHAIVKSWATSGDAVLATLEEIAPRPSASKARPSESLSLNFEKIK